MYMTVCNCLPSYFNLPPSRYPARLFSGVSSAVSLVARVLAH